ncbi:hypothetical protein E2C01_082224 [Portunus trituberculatus]|uniref:Uncharacterized protein n=1 Tax=Portunus trituberculatus TaxID=210409 RepID=A0A5B7IYL9_PORTR|nr:hypothetical protein [Portunus trituberculatus]
MVMQWCEIKTHALKDGALIQVRPPSSHHRALASHYQTPPHPRIKADVSGRAYTPKDQTESTSRPAIRVALMIINEPRKTSTSASSAFLSYDRTTTSKAVRSQYVIVKSP